VQTIQKFSEFNQKNILGSTRQFLEFKHGKDVEAIFNTIREEKYHIRKYVNVFKKANIFDDVLKNTKENELKEIEKKILNKISKIKDVKNDFYTLWINKKSFENHIEKRIKKGHIANVDDYILKTLNCIIEADEYILAIHIKSWNNLCYNKKNNWAVIFNEEGEVMTSYKIENDKKSFEELHKEVGAKIQKGAVNEAIRKAFKRLRDKYKNME